MSVPGKWLVELDRMFYQLSQSTKVCRRMRCIGSNIYYTAIRGGCQDRRRENFLLSVWRAAKARGMGFVPRPTPLLFSACTFLCLRPRTGPPRTLCCSAHAHFPASAPVDRLSTNACCSAHAPSRLRACGQALHERLLFQHLPAPAPTDRPSASALRLQRTRVILPAFIS